MEDEKYNDELLKYAHEYKRLKIDSLGSKFHEDMEKLVFNSGYGSSMQYAHDPYITDEKKEINKLPVFDKYTALDVNTTTIAQRRHIHKLYEELGGAVASSTENKDVIREGKWDYHLYIDTAYAPKPQIRGVRADQTWVYKLKFYSYEWWLRKLNGQRFLDSTESSPNNTFLDKQLEFLQNDKV